MGRMSGVPCCWPTRRALQAEAGGNCCVLGLGHKHPGGQGGVQGGGRNILAVPQVTGMLLCHPYGGPDCILEQLRQDVVQRHLYVGELGAGVAVHLTLTSALARTVSGIELNV